MSFWNRKPINNDTNLNSTEYEKLYKRIVELCARYEELQTKIAILQTNYDNLRGNFNRKLSGLKEDKHEERATSDESNLKPSIFLTPDGNLI